MTDAPPADLAAAVQPAEEESFVCLLCLGILQDLCDPTQAVKVSQKIENEPAPPILIKFQQLKCGVRCCSSLLK